MAGDEREGAPRGTLGTVFNAARILNELATGPPYQQLTDLADSAQLSLPTAHRLLRSLVVADLVQQDPRTSRYGLGPELVRLSEQYLSRLPVIRAAGPYLGDLRNRTKGTVTLSILVGADVVHVDRIDGEDVGGVFRNPARLQTAVSCAAGHVLLAHAGTTDDRGGATAGDVTPSAEQLGEWRGAPHVIREGQPMEMSEIAVPIHDASVRVVAALAVSGAPAAFSREVLERDVAPYLLRTAAAISGTLGSG